MPINIATKQLTGRMVSLLRDGQWHRFGDFVPLGDLVACEVAQRHYLSTQGKHCGYTVRKTVESQIYGGRTLFLRQRLRAMVKASHVFTRGQGEEVEYMLNPESKGPKGSWPSSKPKPKAEEFLAPGLSIGDLGGKLRITGIEHYAPIRNAFEEVKKRKCGREKHGVSVLPLIRNLLTVTKKLTLTLSLDGDRVIVETIDDHG